MRRSLVALVALLGTMACQSLLSSSNNLAGTWEWELNRNPSGSSITLFLSDAGTMVAGTGNVCGVGPTCSPGAVTITGPHTLNTFVLMIRDQNGYLATYSGHFVHSNEVQGLWRHGADSGNVVFFRN